VYYKNERYMNTLTFTFTFSPSPLLSLCHHHHSRYPLLLHSFTPGSKPTFSTNPSHLNRLLVTPELPLWIIGLDWTSHAHQFIFIFFRLNFLFISSCRLRWLPTSFYCTLTIYGSIKTAEQRILYSNTVIGTLAVDGWAVTYG